MPDTLAQQWRAKYPGAYDDLDDVALESAIEAKYPGAYDDLPKTARPEQADTSTVSPRGGWTDEQWAAMPPGERARNVLRWSGKLLGGMLGMTPEAVNEDMEHPVATLV